MIETIILFFLEIRTGLIGYGTVELHRAFKKQVFSPLQYIYRLGITMWILYGTSIALHWRGIDWDLWELLKMIMWGFGIVALWILEEKFPQIFASKIDKLTK